MDNVAASISYALATAIHKVPSPVLIVPGLSTSLSEKFPDAKIWTPWADKARSWEAKGHEVLIDLDKGGKFATAILFVPKQKDEALYFLAILASQIQKAGLLIAAAENQAGGHSLATMAECLGYKICQASKHKCRVVWTDSPEDHDSEALDAALKSGALRSRDDGMLTQPGLFSWNHLDRGTEVLLRHINRAYKGKGADFGCGTGVIGKALFQHNSNISHLHCIDNDVRAMQCAEKNLSAWKSHCSFLWADVRHLPQLSKFDFIVSNPPFHEGKIENNQLGQDFIIKAAEMLVPNGRFLMVANRHLPYEALLTRYYASHICLEDSDGFKVIEAIR